MKKNLLFGMLVCAAITGCDRTATEQSASTSDVDTTREEMFGVARQVYNGMETGDSVLLAKYISDDAIDHGGGPDGGDIRGRQIISMLTDVHNHIDNLKMSVEQQAANDDHVFVWIRMTGKTNKPVWGMPANHDIDTRSVDILKVKDGKATEHWGFIDQAEMMKMMQGGNMHTDTTKTR